MQQNILNSVLVLERQDRSTSEVHQLHVLTATVHQTERSFSEFIKNHAFLVVGDGVVGDDEVVELVEELSDAVSLVHEVTDKVFKLCILFRLADVDEFRKEVLWNDAGHFEDVFEGDVVVGGVCAALQTVAGLQSCDRFSHVTTGNVNDALQRFILDLQLLLVTNELQSLDDFLLTEWNKTELCATRRDWIDDS